MKVQKFVLKSDKKGFLHLDIPTEFLNKEIEVLIAFNQVVKTSKKIHYDFSDLTGKLTWDGDSLSTQKMLRDEW